MAVPPTPLEADVPYSGLRKRGLLHEHSRQHATKTQCWSSCKDPPFPDPTCCPPASTSSTSTTSTASTTCPPHPPPTLLPPPRPARPSSYSLPAYNTRRGGPGLGRRPAPAPPPAPLIKSPATDLATLDDTPINHRKRSFSSLASFLHRLLLSVPSQPDRQAGSRLVQLTAALARPSGAEVGGTRTTWNLVFRRASGSPASLVCSPPGGAGFLPPSLTSGGQRFSPGESHARARARC